MKETNTEQSKWYVIFCGGKGSRLGEIADTTPKSLAKVHGEPVIWYALEVTSTGNNSK